MGTFGFFLNCTRSLNPPPLVYSLLSKLVFHERCHHGAKLEFWEKGSCNNAEGKIHQQTGKIWGISLKGLQGSWRGALDRGLE